jgi:2-polyprenyl-6-methoxyphenol hydroxylase-like FAD-dependent oxidoreductase
MARVLVVGGSLGGLMAANLLARGGHQVTVLEKASGGMEGRGAGIVSHRVLEDGLRRIGMPQDYALGLRVAGRVTFDSEGGVLGRLDMRQILTSWGRLYQLLHGLLPASATYRQGVTAHSVEQDDRGVRVHTNQGTLDGDLLIAADGIRSVIRQQYWPEVQPEYAGYVAWRGLCDEAVISRGAHEALFPWFGFCTPPGEQMLGYPVAGPGNRMEAGQRSWNFVWYRAAPAGEHLTRLLTDADGTHYPGGIPPNKVSWREVANMRNDGRRLLAPALAEIVEKCSQPFLQPIYDVASKEIARGRIALLGDSAFVARPHVGMGVTKAMQDSIALADALAAHGPTPQGLQAYAAERAPVALQVVRRGRRLGAYMQACGQDGVVQTRDALAAMNETAVELDTVDFNEETDHERTQILPTV